MHEVFQCPKKPRPYGLGGACNGVSLEVLLLDRGRGLAASPVTVRTLAGPLALREESGEVVLQGPAELIGGGEFYFQS